MKRIIAVEDNLAPVKEYLIEKGCQVIEIEEAEYNDVDVLVISGSDEDIMGMEDILDEVPVISAQGRSPEDIWHTIMDIYY
ncbi:MAG: YkuS family protein [Syntrophomonadaceae bacterium]|nr:YkuS family protein [Syntrophomonadaceae bacterium]